MKEFCNRNRKENAFEEIEEQLQISSSVIKTKIACLRAQLKRQKRIGKDKGKEIGTSTD